jgi:hypothetical protein
MSEEETITAVENADDAEIATPETEQTSENTSTEDTVAETEDKPEDEAKAEKPKVDLKQRKIAKQAREIREMKREQARMSKMLETQIETASRASKEGEAPKIENYETMDEYLDARDSYRDSKMEASTQEAPTQNPHEDMFANGAERYEDFEEVVNSSDSITQAMATAVFGVDDPDLQVDIAYFLGNNPKDAARISRLPPARQMAEITKLEIQLSSKPVKQTASKAPKPIKPVGGKNTSSDDIQGTEKFESFMKKRNKQLGR